MTANLPESLWHTRPGLVTMSMITNPFLPPMDDLRIRKALAYGIDFENFIRVLYDRPSTAQRGGLVPPGMIGHSPDLAQASNLELARQLLAEAGYPDGKGMPAIRLGAAYLSKAVAGIQRQVKTDLGIELEHVVTKIGTSKPNPTDIHLHIQGWSADYPDPDNFLRQSSALALLRKYGWKDDRYDRLVEKATHSSVRAERMALYREADHILVNEQVLIIPLSYSNRLFIDLYRPEFEPLAMDAMGSLQYKSLRIKKQMQKEEGD